MKLDDIQRLLDEAKAARAAIIVSPTLLRALLKIARTAESFTTCVCEFHDHPDACSEKLDALIKAQDELEAMEIP